MIIAFWSNVHGQPRTTSNMVALAIEAAMKENYNCIITQTHFNMNNLESYLIGAKENSRDIFMNIGIDGLASVIKFRAIDRTTIDNYSIQLLNNKLTLLPGTSAENRKVFLDDMGKTASVLLQEMNRYYDMVFVDVNSGGDEVSGMVLEMADIIVVNLSQNKNVLDQYTASWKIPNKKHLYLFGGYDKDSVYNLHNMIRLYHFLSDKNTGIIPYNTEFMDAQSEGNVIKFMMKNMDAKKNSTNGYFCSCIQEASDKLIKLAVEKRGAKEA